MERVHLCRVEDCSPETRENLQRLSDSLGGSYPGEFLESLACHPEFLAAATEEIDRILSTPEFEHASILLRGFLLREAKMIGIPRAEIHRKVTASGLPVEAVRQMGRELAGFHYVNPKLLLLAEIIGRSLDGEERREPPFPETMRVEMEEALEQRPRHRTTMALIGEEDASDEVREAYSRITERLSESVNREYQALAKFPSYLRIGINVLEPLVGSDGYKLLCDDISNRAGDWASRFASPETFNWIMDRCGYSREKSDELRAVVRSFQDSLPRHCLNITVLWDNIAQERRKLDEEVIAA